MPRPSTAPSPRAGGPLIAINCGAIPRELMESEIFGHRRGSFTGAFADRDGAAKLADGGTLFLDELCELELLLQTKLLRFLDTGVIQKVGSTAAECLDIRIICATNRDPAAEVRERPLSRGPLLPPARAARAHAGAPRAPRGRAVRWPAISSRLLSREEGKSFCGLSPAAECADPGYRLARQRARAPEHPAPRRRPPRRRDAGGRTMLAGNRRHRAATRRRRGPAPAPFGHGPAANRRRQEARRRSSATRSRERSPPAATASREPRGSLGVSPSTIYRKREAWK